jgi:hypothetical protein
LANNLAIDRENWRENRGQSALSGSGMRLLPADCGLHQLHKKMAKMGSGSSSQR